MRPPRHRTTWSPRVREHEPAAAYTAVVLSGRQGPSVCPKPSRPRKLADHAGDLHAAQRTQRRPQDPRAPRVIPRRAQGRSRTRTQSPGRPLARVPFSPNAVHSFRPSGCAEAAPAPLSARVFAEPLVKNGVRARRWHFFWSGDSFCRTECSRKIRKVCTYSVRCRSPSGPCFPCK